MKVVGYAGGFYKNLLQWNPLEIPIKDEWKTLEKDWKSIGSPLMEIHPDLNPYVGDWRRIGELGENYLYALGRLVACPLPMDRTDQWNLFNLALDPIPPTGGVNFKYEDVVLMRAEHIWKQNKPVRVWWSGGIDSTTALCALLTTKPVGAELIILMSEATKIENPSMADTILGNVFDVKIEWSTKENMWTNTNRWDGTTLNITGECGDPMYGTFVVEHHIEEIDEPWEKIFEWDDVNFIYNRPSKENQIHRGKCIEFCREYIKSCPFPIKTTFDFTWWLAFTIKWQWIDRRLFAYLEDPSGWQNMWSFYNTPEFQKWSMMNHDLKHKGTWKTYKWPSKEFIYKFNRDATYRDNKVKETSFPKTAPVGLESIRNKLIMDDGTYYRRQKPLPPTINKWDVLCKPTFERIKEKMYV